MLLAFRCYCVAAPRAPRSTSSFGKHIPSGLPSSLVSGDAQYLSEKRAGFLRKLLRTFGCLLARGALDLDEVLIAIHQELNFCFAAARAAEAVCLRQFAQFVQRNELQPTEMCADPMTPIVGPITSFVSANESEVSRLDVTPNSFVALLRFKRMVKIAERNEVVWGMGSTFCNGAHMVNMQFQS